jgi:hypothetical protein
MLMTPTNTDTRVLQQALLQALNAPRAFTSKASKLSSKLNSKLSSKLRFKQALLRALSLPRSLVKQVK